MASQGRTHAALPFNQHKSRVLEGISEGNLEEKNKGGKEELLKALETSKDERVSSPNEEVTPEGGDFRKVIKGVSDHYEGKGRVGQRVLKKLGKVVKDNPGYLKHEVKVIPEGEEVSPNDESKNSKTELDKILSEDPQNLTKEELNILLEHKFSEADNEWLLEHFDILGRENQDRLIDGLLEVHHDPFENGDFATIFCYFNKINGRPDLQKKCVDEAFEWSGISEMLFQVDGISGSGFEQYIAKNLIVTVKEGRDYHSRILNAFSDYLQYYKGIPRPYAYFIVNTFLFGKEEQVESLESHIKEYYEEDYKEDIKLTKIEKERKITSFLKRKGDIRLDEKMAIELLKSLEEHGNPETFKIGKSYNKVENKTLDYVIGNISYRDVFNEEDFIRAFVRVERGGMFLLEKIRNREFSVNRRLLLKVLKEDPSNVRLIAENLDLFPVYDEEHEGPELIIDLIDMVNKLDHRTYHYYPHPVWHNIDKIIDKFSMDDRSVVRILIAKKSFRHIDRDIDKLKGLTPTTIELLKNALKESGKDDVVDDHPEIFGSDDTEEIKESA